MWRIKLLLVYILIIFLSACKKKDVGPGTNGGNNQDEIELLEPEILDGGGVKLSIKINSVPDDHIYSFGLVVSRDSLFTRSDFLKTFELPMRVKTYAYEIPSGLDTNTVYYYKCFVNNNLNYTSKPKAFLFGKEKSLKIDSISSRAAGIGDTLKIYGQFKDYNFTKVMIGDSVMTYFAKRSDNEVHVVLRENTPIGKQQVSLFTKYQRTVAEEIFELPELKISNVPAIFAVDQDIAIVGENFSNHRYGNKVFINDVEVEVNSYSKSELKITIPNTIQSASLQIKVQANNQTAIAPTKITLIEPEIIEVPDELRIGQPISIKFKNLPNVNIQIALDGISAHIYRRSDQGGYNTILLAGILADYKNRQPKLVLKYLDKEIVLKNEIKILDKWAYLDSQPPFTPSSFYGAVECNGDTYIAAHARDVYLNFPFRLWKFNSNGTSFDEIEVPYLTESPLVSAHENVIYLYTGKDTDNFYQYTPATKVWKKLKDYPSINRFGAVMNSVNGKLYMTGGANRIQFGNTKADNTLYRYDIERNEWTRLQDYPYFISEEHGNRMHASSLSIDNYFIVVGGAKTTGGVETMAFNTLTNSWERKADFPPVMWTASFVHNGQGIVLKEIFRKYNSNKDTWTNLDQHLLPYAYSTETRATLFKHAEYVYCAYSLWSGEDRFFRIRLADFNL